MLTNYLNSIHFDDEAVARFIYQWQSSSEYIVAHTSGSTGSPKEIRLLKSDMVKSAESTCRFFCIGSGSRMVCPLSVDYIAGKMMVVRAIVSGAELFMEHPSNNPINKDYGRVDLLPVVPSQLAGLLENPTKYKIRNVIVGGAPISPNIERRLIDAPFSTYATYGMTETCSHVALRKVGEDFYEALPGFTFETDRDSCVIINSSSMSFNRLVTNDIVELKDKLHFRWAGRRDNVIISGGLKIIPEELEKRVRHVVPFNFYFAGVNDEKWGQKLVMYIESEQSVDTEAITAKLKLILSRHEVPKEIIVKPEFERTSSGKTKRTI